MANETIAVEISQPNSVTSRGVRVTVKSCGGRSVIWLFSRNLINMFSFNVHHDKD
jgi:hypothetical protein